MKKILVFLLLVSLGLNVGLGMALWRHHDADESHRHIRDRHEGPPVPGDGKPGRSSEEFMKRKLRFMTRKLDLSQDQIDAIERLHGEVASEILAQAQAMRAARLELRAAAGDPDSGRIRTLITDVGRQQARLDSLVTEAMILEMEILNETQREEYLRHMPSDRFEGRFGLRGKGRGKGHGGQ